MKPTEPTVKFSSRCNDENILGTFWEIVSNNKDVRLENTEKLINIISQKQTKCKTREISNELEYTVERLVKGISSTRKSARLGYTVALSLLLKKFQMIKLSHVVELIEKYQSLDGNKSEKIQSLIIGRTLALESIVRSQRLMEEPSLIAPIVEKLLGLMLQRSYIQVAVLEILEDLFQQITHDTFETYVFPCIKDQLSISWEKCTPQDLWLLLTCQRLFEKVIPNDFIIKHWESSPVINEETFSSVGDIIRQTVSVHPFIHPVCKEIINSVVKSGFLEHFCKSVIGGKLLENNQFERAFLAFELVKIVLSHDIPAKEKEVVLSRSVISILIKCVKVKHHPLYLASEQMFEFLVKTVQDTKDDALQLLILKSLLLPPGGLLLDNETKHKYFKKIVSHLSPENLKAYGLILKRIIKNVENNELVKPDKILASTIQSFAISELTNLLSQPSIMDDFKVEILMDLFLWGYFTEKPKKSSKKDCIPDMALSVIQASRQNFFRGIDILTKPKTLVGYHIRLLNTCELLMPLLNTINEILESHENFEPQINLKEFLEQWRSMHMMVKKLNKRLKKNPEDEDCRIFITLFINLGFHLFYENQKNIPEILEELSECAKRALKEKKSSSEDIITKSDEPPWVGVLMDLFLSLLSEGSSYICNVVGYIFPLFGSRINEEILQQILDVLNPEKGKDLVENEDEKIESMKEEVEFESGSSSEDESSEVESSVTDPDEEFRNKVLKALGPAADFDEESDEQYLSDSEMFKLDDAISAAFRGRIKTNKKDEGQKLLLTFRLRCMDLIAKYIKSRPSLKHILQCIPNLIDCLEYALKNNKNQQGLQEKTISTLSLITHTHKFSSVENISSDDLQDLFNVCVEKLRHVTDSRFANHLSDIGIYLVICSKKIPINEDDNDEMWYAGVFERLLKEYFEEINCHINPAFFTKLFDLCPEAGSELLESLSKYAFSDKVRLFHKSKALYFLRLSVNAVIKAKLSISTNKKYWSVMWSTQMPKFTNAIKEMSNNKLKVGYTFELISTAIKLLQIRKTLCVNTDVSAEFVEALKSINSKKGDRRVKKALKEIRKILGIKIEPEVMKENSKRDKRKRKNSESIDIENKTAKLGDGELHVNGYNANEADGNSNILSDKSSKKNKKTKKLVASVENGDNQIDSAEHENSVSEEDSSRGPKLKKRRGNVNSYLGNLKPIESERNTSNPKIKKKRKMK